MVDETTCEDCGGPLVPTPEAQKVSSDGRTRWALTTCATCGQPWEHVTLFRRAS